MSTTIESPPGEELGSPVVTTPRARSVGRRVLLWAVLALFAIVVVVLVAAITAGSDRPVDTLSIESTRAEGAMAVAEVLRDHGVEVVRADSLTEVRGQVDDPNGTTILLFDLDGILGSDQRQELLGIADRLIVVEPWDTELADLAPGVTESYDVLQVVTADCAVPAVQKAGTVDAPGAGYLIDNAAPGTVGCLAADTGEYGLVQTETGGTSVTILGLGDALSNGAITTAGNAALALNLLGERAKLVWYIPTIDDLAGTTTIDELTPPWVTPLAVLLLLTGLAAAFWRGRRVGPLVVENLPVVVRARETMEGRARLYERAGARLHALDALRIGTVSRLASTCGVPRTATVPEIIDAVAAISGRPRDAVAELLLDRAPANDADLVRLSDDLLRLESDVTRIERAR